MADMRELSEPQRERPRSFRREDVPAKGYTYRDYLSWGDDVRFELLDGIPHMMAAPTRWHQRVAGEIARQLGNWLEGKPCEVYIAPFDVRLFPRADGSDGVVVQPDVLVVCDGEKLSDDKACRGAPDFVVEVASKGTRGKDFGEKKALYEKAGVREYWVVEPDAVYKYLPVDGAYQETVCDLDEDDPAGNSRAGNSPAGVSVDVLPGCSIDFRSISPKAVNLP